MGGIRKYRKSKYKSAGVENISTEPGRAILTQTWQKNITANLRNRYWEGIIHSKAAKSIVLTVTWFRCDFIHCNFNRMQYHEYLKEVDIKYAIGSNVCSQYCIRNNKKYVKCDMCNATGYIEGDIIGTIFVRLNFIQD